MELDFIRVLEVQRENKSSAQFQHLPYSSYNFIENNKSLAIPYLTFISVLTFIGTFGNMLVLGTLVINKVRTLFLLFALHILGQKNM